MRFPVAPNLPVTLEIRRACVARPAPPVIAPAIAPLIKPSAPPFKAALPAPYNYLLIIDAQLPLTLHRLQIRRQGETRLDGHPFVQRDRGFQYTSEIFLGKLKKEQCIQSMSQTGRCIDNAL